MRPSPADARAAVPGESIEELEADLEDLAALHGDGTISMGEWLAARAPLQERLTAAKVGSPVRPASVERLLSRPGAARKAWPDLGITARRDLLDALIEKIVIGPATGRGTTIEERLDPDQGYGVVWRVR